MWAKLSSTDLMVFLLQESLGSRRRWRGGVGEFLGKGSGQGELTFLPNQKQKAGFKGSGSRQRAHEIPMQSEQEEEKSSTRMSITGHAAPKAKGVKNNPRKSSSKEV